MTNHYQETLSYDIILRLCFSVVYFYSSVTTGEEHVNLTIKVANRNEPAYEANVYISHPASLSFVGRKAMVSLYVTSRSLLHLRLL